MIIYDNVLKKSLSNVINKAIKNRQILEDNKLKPFYKRVRTKSNGLKYYELMKNPNRLLTWY